MERCDDVGKEFFGELFAFVVPDVCQNDALLVALKFVIFQIAGQIDVGASADGFLY